MVAEGIETPAQMKWLGQLGCDKLQGFHFGRPMDRDRFFATWHRAEDDPVAPAA